MSKKYGFMRVGAAVSKIKISDVEFNVESIKKVMDEAYPPLKMMRNAKLRTCSFIVEYISPCGGE